MSWSCRLTDAKTGETIMLDRPNPFRGGMYKMGEDYECWLNVTYNYGTFFRRVYPEDSLWIIEGKTGREAIPLLLKIASVLDYSDKTLTIEEIRNWRGDHVKSKTDEETLAYWEECRKDIKGSYWDITEGNALRAVLGLINLCAMAPDGVWKLD